MMLLNKLSFADGTDTDLVTKSLDSNKCIEQCLSLFISITGQYMDRRCVFFCKPLLESGTLGTKGNTQVYLV